MNIIQKFEEFIDANPRAVCVKITAKEYRELALHSDSNFFGWHEKTGHTLYCCGYLVKILPENQKEWQAIYPVCRSCGASDYDGLHCKYCGNK
jgi:hypothetical protein